MSRNVIAMLAAGIALVVAGIVGAKRGDDNRAQRETPGTFVIANVAVFDGQRLVGPASVTVRDGVIAAIGEPPPSGATMVEGEGRTLLPGLIDAHTHAFNDALTRALVFGVTTELDMFTDHRFAARMREEQRSPDGAATRADLLSAGTLVTAPGGHGTEYGVQIPTLASAADADAFVAARIAEGSDYIKIVYDDGASYGLHIPTIDRDTLRAAIGAAKRRDRMALVHIGSRKAAEEAIEAGASGLIHLFADREAGAGFAAAVARAGAFVTPTLSVIESTTGRASGASLGGDPRIAPLITAPERTALGASFPRRPGSTLNLEHALDTTRRLHELGVPILAGTDAPNPGTAHGASIHRELELLVRAGLSAEAALAAATSVPARVFGLTDRGRIASGLRADLLLVTGDPTRDITATRDIVAVWKAGVRAERLPASAAPGAPIAATTTGLVSDFESGEARAEFGAGWQISTDSRMGGKSVAAMEVVEGGAGGSGRALAVSGTLAAGALYPWAGAMFFPADNPMAPADLSRFKSIVFSARGDGGRYQLMVFADRLGNIPATHAFTAGSDWQEFAVPFASLSGLDGTDIKGILFSAGTRPGAFRLVIDDVRFR
ncbi:MAG TPA: CIA30 family protein [Vicinamibacterales bacterium]|nr:CIA30 family protein [Vicinamibacterales bacterium]